MSPRVCIYTHANVYDTICTIITLRCGRDDPSRTFPATHTHRRTRVVPHRLLTYDSLDGIFSFRTITIRRQKHDDGNNNNNNDNNTGHNAFYTSTQTIRTLYIYVYSFRCRSNFYRQFPTNSHAPCPCGPRQNFGFILRARTKAAVRCGDQNHRGRRGSLRARARAHD